MEQARLLVAPASSFQTGVDANGNALPGADSESSGDGSFGAQIVLKNQQTPRSFSVAGDAGVFLTTNAGLTPENARRDTLVTANASLAWRPVLGRELVGDFFAGASVVRYHRLTELDFDRFAAGAGLNWLVPHTPGIVALLRYDFVELTDRGGSELVQDHGVTLGAQKTFAFGRTHFLTTGLAGVAGFTNPRSEERDQAAFFAAYHLQLTRVLEADLLYRYAAQFYTGSDRLDHNQTVTLTLGMMATSWLRVGISISGTRNDSNWRSNDYEVLNTGGALRMEIRF